MLPAFIVFLILAPSLVLLYSSDVIKVYDHCISVTASQWYWTYLALNVSLSTFYNSYMFDIDSFDGAFREFITADSFIPFHKDKKAIIFSTKDEFDSYLLSENDLEKGSKRLLDTDRHVIAPSLSGLKFVVSSVDVLHSFALPSVGLKVDAVTGRLNMVSLLIAKDGLITGQCSELCGSGHHSMPIVLEIMYPFDFRSYLENLFWVVSEIDGNCPLLSLDDKTAISFRSLKAKENSDSVIEEKLPYEKENKWLHGYN